MDHRDSGLSTILILPRSSKLIEIVKQNYYKGDGEGEIGCATLNSNPPKGGEEDVGASRGA